MSDLPISAHRWRLPRAAGFISWVLLSVLLGVSQTSASALEVSPTLLDVLTPKNAEVVRLTNSGDTEVSVQIRVFSWTQPDNDDVLLPTSAVVASPPVARIAAGTSQVIRIVRIAEGAPVREEAYRMLIDELPDSHTNTGVKVLLRYSVPVFFSAKNLAYEQSFNAAVFIAPGNETVLRIRNTAGRRLKLSQIALTDGLLPPLRFSEGLLGYVLSGGERHWEEKTPNSWANISDELRMTGKTGAGELNVPVSSNAKR